MGKLLLLLLFIPRFLEAQVIDSTTFAFSGSDSLIHYMPSTSGGGQVAVSVDTTGTTLWKIGNTIKPVFSNDTTAMRGIMTDTSNPYRANANDFFVLKIGPLPNVIVSCWHKYQTDSLHAGGIIEFSSDSGITWTNIANCPDMVIQNVYSPADTLITGQPAFTGTSDGEQLSSFQFVDCIAARQTATGCFPSGIDFSGSIYVRFHFISDSTTDSLSGWMIDSIKIADYECFGIGGVRNITDNKVFNLFPNPATSQLTIQSPGEVINYITITDILGEIVYSSQSTVRSTRMDIDVTTLPSGIYFVKINNEVRRFAKE